MSTVRADNAGPSAGGTTTGLISGLAKAWFHVTYSGGTPTLEQSNNVSSLTDAGAGALEANYTSSTSTDTCAASFSCTNSGSNDAYDGSAFSTSLVQLRHYESGGTLTDPVFATGNVHGDLA